MKRSLTALLLTTIPLLPLSLEAEAGTIAPDLTFPDFGSNAEVSFSDFEGEILFLEFFAWWCPFCVTAARDITTELIPVLDANDGRNIHGVPVRHVAISISASGNVGRVQNFVNTYNLTDVWDDDSRNNMVQLGGSRSGQPFFAIVNGVSDSPTHAQWEIVYTRDGYLTTSQPIQDFLDVLDSIEPGAPGNSDDPMTLESPWAAFTLQGGAKNTAEFGETGIGWLEDDRYPFVFSYSFAQESNEAGWLYILPETAALDGKLAYHFASENWLWMHNNFGGWFYRYPTPAEPNNGWERLPGF